ncbi:MAG: thermonuclease family protein [Hyphomicrobium sp.]
MTRSPRERRRVSAMAVAAAIMGVVSWSALAEPQRTPQLSDAKDEACRLAPGPMRTVVRVIDGETLLLDDGVEVRLIGALAPRAADAGATAGQWPPETVAITFLSELTLGRRVRLAFGGRRTDRYGRRLAHVFLAEGGRTAWVQGALLEAGLARAYGLPESFDCTRELDAHEREARLARRGLWANATYSAMPAERPRVVMSRRFRFVRVEGVVRSVTSTRGAIYVNFGADWRTDFTARATKAVTIAHPDLEGRLKALDGARVSVRGWIDRNNGPMIDIADPSQIERLDSDIEIGRGDAAAPGLAEPSRAEGSESDSTAPNENRPKPSETDPGGVDL